MNLPKFLKEVDHISGLMSKEEIAGFVHDIARTLPEAMREDFLGHGSITANVRDILQRWEKSGNLGERLAANKM